MECDEHVMSPAHYVTICECATYKVVLRLSGSSSSEICLSVSQVISSIASEVTGGSGINSVSEDKLMVFKTCRGPLPIYPRWYELPLGTFRSGNLSVAPIR